MKCPRRISGNRDDKWEIDDTCSYCGSLNPDIFMERIREETVELTPTDKNYKVYIENAGGEKFKNAYRKDCDCKFESRLSIDEVLDKIDLCPHWIMDERERSEFYFYHLSDERKCTFVSFVNNKKVRIGYPGYFYVLPFFMGRVEK